jgi:hypothetical protein
VTAGGVAQVVECLLSNSETLSSNPRTEKEKEKKEQVINTDGIHEMRT